jgi:hypothetical protein
MAAPQISVRMSPELYKALVKLSQMEHKNLAELTRELIETGLGTKTTPQADIKTELQFMEMRLSELIARGVKGSAIASYYAKLATETTEETAHYLTTAIKGGEVLNKEAKKQRIDDRRQTARKVSEHFMTESLDKL